jgi:hypothetical protein
MNKKFIGYFTLVEAFNKKGCPVCVCVEEDARKQMKNFLYENVNDPELRSQIHESFGPCAWHASILKEIQDSAFGISILYADILELLIEKLKNLTSSSLKFSKWRGGFGKSAFFLQTPCIFCREVVDSEKRYLKTLLDFIEDPEFHRAYSQSDGICVPHLQLLMQLHKNNPGIKQLIHHAISRFENLKKELESFRGKNGWKNKRPFTPEEIDAAALVLNLLTGAPGLFSNQKGKFCGSIKVEKIQSHSEPSVSHEKETPTERDLLEFQNKRLELRSKELLHQLNEKSSEAASLKFKLWEVLEAKKTLELQLSGQKAEVEMSQKTIEKLRDEIENLRNKQIS